jgi:DNA-binding XRE family transcriptional regulator
MATPLRRRTPGVWMRRKEDGAVLRRKRQKQQLSQGELAFLVGCSHTTIYLLEKAGPRGMQTCSEQLAIEIARRLHVDPEDLWEERQGSRPRSRMGNVSVGRAAAGGRAA